MGGGREEEDKGEEELSTESLSLVRESVRASGVKSSSAISTFGSGYEPVLASKNSSEPESGNADIGGVAVSSENVLRRLFVNVVGS